MELARRLVVLAILFAPVLAGAAGKRSLAVAVAPAGWRAVALGQALSADLADDQLAPRAEPACGGPCGDAALRGAGVELVVRAVLDGPRLGYELRALWPGAPAPVRGSIALGGLDRAGLAGVLRDQLHRLARATTEAGAERAAPPILPDPGAVAIAVAAVLALLATPLALGALWTRRLVGWTAIRRSLIGAAGLGALAIGVAVIAPGADGAVLAAGGIAWGIWAVVTLPVAIPPLVGISRIDYRELGRVVAAWGGLVIQRAVLLAVLYAPIAAAVIALAGVRPGAIALAVPVALLVWRQWVRLVVAVAAEQLDQALAEPAADAAAWHAAVRGYLVGYLRRNGLPIDDALIDRLAIVPAAGDAVCVYGGGATHTRIAIPRKLLELALAPWGRPHDYAAPRVSTLHWTQWNAGLVMATEPGAAVATREQRQPRETTAEGDPSANAREHIGEPPTLIGIIEPAALDPRRSYRPHDDPAWLDWDTGDDYDGTDAVDRDFLFGVLIAAIARVQRHGDRLSTLALVIRGGRFDLGRRLARWTDAAGDDHAAIQGARHHLVQYLGWRVFQREDLLTARAYAPELATMSRRVLAALADPGDPSAADRAAPLRARLARLAGYVEGAPPPRARWRRLVIAGAVVAGASGVAIAVTDAVRYHAAATDRSRPTPEKLENAHGKT